LGVALQQGQPLRVILRITNPQLAALPWEALFDKETGDYVCRTDSIVRHVPAPYTPDPLEVVPPLRVLGLVASPRGLSLLDVEAEKQRLEQALAQPISDGLIEVVWVDQASWDSVHDKLLSGAWHVLHFIGHGDFDAVNDQGLIALVGEDGKASYVDAARLANLLDEANPTPRLVLLNSCRSGEGGAYDLFSGTASALVRSGISAVVAMQFSISDQAAIAFAKGFYTAIAHGHSIDDAARSGRIAILGLSSNLEWVTPVLYVRGEATELFRLTGERSGEKPRLPSRSLLSRVRSLSRRAIVGMAASAAVIAVAVGFYLHLHKPSFATNAQGFVGYTRAQCNALDSAALLARTENFLIAVCKGPAKDSDGRDYYYIHGVVLEDIDFAGQRLLAKGEGISGDPAVHSGLANFAATTPSQKFTYFVGSDRFTIAEKNLNRKIVEEPWIDFKVIDIPSSKSPIRSTSLPSASPTP
jgi:hypothetical protein